MDIFDAADGDHFERVRELIEQDPNLVRAVEGLGWTALMLVVRRGHLEMVQYLLDRDAEINHRNLHNSTPLHMACWNGHADVASLLLQRGADVKLADNDRYTPLIAAANRGHAETLGVLVRHDSSNIDAADRDGNTAVHHACLRGHESMLRVLLKAGADCMLRKRDGETPLDLAVEKGQQPCVTMLQEWERAYTMTKARRLRDARATVARST